MKILLVEDSATLRHAMSQYIVDAGHTPLVAESGEQALQLLEDNPVDMIIMDVEMPGLNGFETTALIREWLGDHWIPIVFVTGMSEDEDYRQGIEAGGDDYLIKPVSKMIITAKIRAMERIADMRDQLNRLNSELEAISQLDSLTQIYNRRTFNEQALKQWLLASRQNTCISALMIDVDHFKLYNDHYGHPAGDACLKEVTAAIEQCLNRPYDLLGRYGGEEFVVLLPETNKEGIANISQRIRRSLADRQVAHDVSPTSDTVTVSIGGACCLQTTGHTLEGLIKAADRALYRAKHSGRDQFSIDEMASHRTVVVAHSDLKIQQQACTQLQQHYNLITADSADEALELSLTIRPDLIVLGPELADHQGRYLSDRLATAKRTRSTPQLFLGQPQGEGLDAKPCVALPLQQDDLIKVAGQLLSA
ncbi:diguanylate cyclase [Gilvimarinus sp. SDUM040013]|uniref:diguanylate cyclase n=1 Tax=Gilvimarinus gilvus TaxID=3058038 RepID=A0ABU4RSH6_9GAMM|nr:diguanylate cyclase [Gilvimarinus sp. SDUM040013]MDO3388287.1 diguanylate cyclase [Gilvimarinus sp. SDUM040013]MDX6847837.1 diguanylate cyclase [Gilvimarinus sp. SDUM040013]